MQNGLDAQALNEKFKALTANSRCTSGEQACVVGNFAQCVGDRFVLSACAGGTSCFALPLVNSRGTSLTCTTAADAQARIATAIGTDAGAVAPQPTTQAPKPTTATVAPPAASNSVVPPAAGDNKPFVVQNGLDAQALNEQFKTLSRNTVCRAGQQACIEDGFAQCVGERFVISACAGGLSCFALPLVNSRGTSLTCTTEADAQTRITTALGAGAGAVAPTSQAPPRPTATATATRPPTPSPPAASNSVAPATGGAKSFTLQNGLDAQALNKKFATLTANSKCSGE